MQNCNLLFIFILSWFYKMSAQEMYFDYCSWQHWEWLSFIEENDVRNYRYVKDKGKWHLFQGIIAQPTEKRGRGTQPVSTDSQTSFITWQFNNCWKSTYLHHVAVKRGGSIAFCRFHCLAIYSSIFNLRKTSS